MQALLGLKQKPLLNIKNWAPASQLYVNSMSCWSKGTKCKALLGCVSLPPKGSLTTIYLLALLFTGHCKGREIKKKKRLGIFQFYFLVQGAHLLALTRIKKPPISYRLNTILWEKNHNISAHLTA
jgi:hypothetical protein